MNFLSSFAPKLVYPITGTDKTQISQIGGGKTLPILVVPREKTRFQRLSLPAGDHRSSKAAKMQARQTTNYDVLRVRIVPDRNNKQEASAWLWDGSISNVFENNLFKPSSVPESLIYEPIESGIRLIKCINGFEGQVFEGWNLKTSRWWPQVPTLKDWIVFARSARQSIDTNTTQAPVPVSPKIKKIYSPFDFDTENIRDMFSPLRVGLLLGGIFCFCLTYQITRISSYSLSAKMYTNKYDEFLVANEDAMRQRQAAISASRDYDKLKARLPQVNIADVLSAFAKEIPASTAKLNRVNINEDNVQIDFATSQEIDSVELIGNFETYPFLYDVYIEPNSNNGSYSYRAKTAPLIKSE